MVASGRRDFLYGASATLLTPPPGGALLGGTSIGAAAKSGNPEAARLYVAWITSASVARKTALGGTSPARISLFKDPELVQRHPHYPPVLAALTGETLDTSR
jgi:multiple sugar transport system substrate-binding protein